MASSEGDKQEMTMATSDGESGDSGGAGAAVQIMLPMNGNSKRDDTTTAKVDAFKVTEPALPSDTSSRDGGCEGRSTSDVQNSENTQPSDNNLQLQQPQTSSPGTNNPLPVSEVMAEKSQTNNISGGEGTQLTVIDGPLAKGALGESGEGIGPLKNSSVTDDLTHSRDSSAGSSLGELIGESPAILENGTTMPDQSTRSEMDVDSTENLGEKEQVGSTGGNHEKPPGHASSKSTSDMAESMAAAAVNAGDKSAALLKHSASSPPETAVRRAQSSQRPKSNRERVDSSQDLSSELMLGQQTDDDEDDENDIPPHIVSKIVEKSPAERYIRFKEKLGSGAYKDVYRAYDTIEGIEVAWNVVKLSGVPKVERVRIVNEVRLLERLHHQNIISFHGSWVNRETERVIFVTEILSSGTLKSFVQKVQLIRWKIFKRWAIQILKGLEYLHSQDPPIIHRDLKCDNIFINGTSGDLRIGDFGLSTAISKKNQPLSVLGTPEFMAPELYDENYNEKVDIYAFGMLLLEIITRDVPYHECANPAQIYKKVTQGIPPSSLRRVKSRDARDFILLCLGIGEDANARPSASDLLKHEFLAKKSDDDTTIEVEPAVEDMVIEEVRNSMTFSDTGSEPSSSNDQSKKYASSIDGHEIPSCGAVSSSPSEQGGKSPRIEKKKMLPPKSNKAGELTDAPKSDEETDDHFGEMPENEANMKKVTVLMGRGTALKEDEEPPAQEMEVISLSTTPPPATVKASMPRSNSEAETSSLGSSSHYKVSEMLGEEVVDGSIKPYPGDAINLVLTLPDEGQTRIEFDFDLVNDDPVQVAREMVMELEEVPDDAVLDISGAISGVARQARIKQNHWTKLQQQQQQQNALAQQALQQQQQQGMMMHTQGSVIPPQGISAQGTIMMPQQHMYGSGYASGNFQNPAGTMTQPQGGSLAQPHLTAQGNDPSSVIGPSSSTLQQQPSQPQLQASQSQPQLQTSQPQHNHVAHPAPPPPPQMAAPQMSTPQPSTQMSISQAHQHQVQHAHHQLPASPAAMPQASSQQYPPPPQPTMTRSNSMEMSTHAASAELNTNQGTVQMPSAQPVPMQQLIPRSISNSSQDLIAPRQLAPPVGTQDIPTNILQDQNQSANQGTPATSPPPQQQQQQQQAQTQMHLQPQTLSVPEAPSDAASDSGEVDTEEIRKLEQEFEKKMQRAKKSYGTRMDNLHRSKEEAESQHQMTLEKHEKERVEFEKRVRLAEEEQNRRLTQIQKEFIEKKKEVRQQRAKQPVAPLQNGTGDSRPPLHSGGHKRSSSHFDSSMAAAPNPIAVTDHKRNSSDSGMLAEASRTLLEPNQQQQQPPKSGTNTSGEQKRPSLPPNLPKARQVGSSSNARDRSGSTSS